MRTGLILSAEYQQMSANEYLISTEKLNIPLADIFKEEFLW